ncbi:DUF4097 family beta strand repeat protein [Carboxylicivirga sediminis]|uniref:DUF4097 family beta strand repeat protein n=1 Tax=Carboxylicivirga sediminis TaxID=2006564 RepID=A0A941F6Z7_9BACT|nr:DUF4097 family beta strand repeat-containing protein [Carboxylicivirga sediminis]MBR8537602.1 DUF4097 family beta strand repeat protein [Carboxylicivirga sediminis]
MRSLFIYMLCFNLFGLVSLSAQDEANDSTVITKAPGRTHVVKKDFDATNIDELKVTNKHGFVYVSSWEEETIQVDITVNMETRYESNLEEFLSLVSFEDRRYNRTSHLKTTFSEDFFSNYPFTINYRIKIPARLNLDINNSIGDVKIDSISGAIKLKHSYGNLELTQIAPDKLLQLDLAFTEGLIDNFGEIKANLNNCTLNINNGQKLKGKTNYCMAGITNVSVMELQTSTDRLTINQVDSLSLKGSQFIGKVKGLSNYLFCELERGQLLVEANQSVKEVTISNKRAKTTLTLPSELTYLLNGAVTNGSFTHPSPQDLLLYKENGTVSFSGTIGETETPQANLILFNEDASITIKN